MSVVKSKRKESPFEASDHFITLRHDVLELLMSDFGLTEDKVNSSVRHYARRYSNLDDAEERTIRYRNYYSRHLDWFIERERDICLSLLRTADKEFTLGNSIFPSPNSIRCDIQARKAHFNNSIAYLYSLKNEINFVLMEIPVDFNKALNFDKSIEQQIKLIKGVRKSSNKYLRNYETKRTM